MNMGISKDTGKKKAEEVLEKSKGEKWTQVQKAVSTKASNRNKGKEVLSESGISLIGMVQVEGRGEQPRTTASINPFETLNTSTKISK